MWQWIASNAETLNVLANVSMLLVWLTYLQIFLAGYRRARRAKIMINRGGGTDSNARCLLSNMSAEPVFVLSIDARVEAEGMVLARQQLTDLEQIDHAAEEREPFRMFMQGPLHAGQSIDIGSFEDLLNEVATAVPLAPLASPPAGEEREAAAGRGVGRDALWRRADTLEITVTAAYGPDDLLVGARRSFRMRWTNGRICMWPASVATEQIRSWVARRRLSKALAAYTAPPPEGEDEGAPLGVAR